MDYNILRKLVASCVEGKDNDPRFKLNMFKLRKKVEGLGLIPVVAKNNYESKMVTVDDVPLLAEYFKENKIAWFDSDKSYLTVVFVRAQDMDDTMQECFQDLLFARNEKRNKEMDSYVCGVKKVDCHKKKCEKCYGITPPDEVVAYAHLVGNYPCYTALIAKWIKPDSVSLNIRFRANPILINLDDDETTTE